MLRASQVKSSSSAVVRSHKQAQWNWCFRGASARTGDALSVLEQVCGLNHASSCLCLGMHSHVRSQRGMIRCTVQKSPHFSNICQFQPSSIDQCNHEPQLLEINAVIWQRGDHCLYVNVQTRLGNTYSKNRLITSAKQCVSSYYSYSQMPYYDARASLHTCRLKLWTGGDKDDTLYH